MRGVQVYMILGCGDVGFSVASKLKEKQSDVVIIDRNAKRVEQLRRMGYRAIVGDFGLPEVLKRAGIEQADMVLIMVPDFLSARAALVTINGLKIELKKSPVVVVRVSDEAEVNDAKWLGASDALPASQILADLAIGKFEKLNEMAKEKHLRELLLRHAKEGEGKIAIILQTNPDPDSIASGVALKLYARAFGVDADIIYNGVIGHSQNRALVNALHLDLFESINVDFKNYTSFALVDVATHANCALPRDIFVPTIVIDHHSVPSGEISARHKDITFVGAASTILTNYLRYGSVEIDKATAAALILGIVTDTKNFTRGVTSMDLEAYRYLRNKVDSDLLGRLLFPSMPMDFWDALATAIKSRKIKGGYMTANVGEVKDRDILAQIADYLLSSEGVTTTFVYGICGDVIRVSARTDDVALHLGQTLKKTFSGIGSAGGHPQMAAGEIPLKVLGRVSKGKLRKQIDLIVARKFLEAVGVVKPPKPRRKRTK